MQSDCIPSGAVADPRAPQRSLLEPPGGLLMWIIVGLELVTFSFVFGVVAHLRATEPALFAAGQAHLDPRLGVALTLALLTSGWLAAEAVHAFRAGRLVATRRYYAASVGIGLVFVGLKVLDYVEKSRVGLGLDDDFGAAYVLATGFHFAHVLVGLAMLAYVAVRVGRKRFEDTETAVAGTALFWHMCDIAWFFLFPLFYAR